MPNLRGHGSAEASSHGRKGWAEFPFDTLGAWDYVVKDPENKLGGARDASQVGIMGFSMGGITAASAFGLEPKAPALWLDGALFDPLDLLCRFVPLPRLVLAPAWWLMEVVTGIPMRANIPKRTLTEACAAGDGPSKRPVMVVGSGTDTDVPPEVTKNYVNLQWTQAADYCQALCDFWSQVFFKADCQADAVLFQ